MSIVVISGIIGVGKTTLCENIKKIGYKIAREDVKDNVFLKMFYNENHKNKNTNEIKNKYAFHNQLFFIKLFHENLIKNIGKSSNDELIIFDRYIFESVHVFSQCFKNYMSKDEWDLYMYIAKEFMNFMPQPKKIIYLTADIKTIMERIKKRSANIDETIDENYILNLKNIYDDYMNCIPNVEIINTTNMNEKEVTDYATNILKNIN